MVAQASTFVIPPHIIAEAMSTLHGLDLRWSSPITPMEMNYVEQYVRARYPHIYDGELPAVSLSTVGEELETNEDGSCGSSIAQSSKLWPGSEPSTPRDMSAVFGSTLPETKRTQLEPSRLLDTLGKQLSSPNNSISIPEMHARNRVLKHCGLSEDDYFVVFTANSKEALILVGESYPFFRYNVYLTVLESKVDCIRDYAAYKDSKVLPAASDWLDLRKAGSQLSQQFRKKIKHSPKGLFAYTASMEGTRNSLHWVSEAQRNCWHVLLDASDLVLGEDQLNLTHHKPDFAVCTLPKVVGQPIKISCLLVRRSSFATNS